MSTNSKNKRPWKERIRDKYRLVVLNDETLREVSSYKLNLLNLYILLTSMIVVVGLLVYALIVFTPLKRTIPGYGDISTTPEFISLKEKTKILEKDLIAINSYLDANKNRLLGNPNNSSNQLIGQAYQPVEIDYVDTIVTNSEDENQDNVIKNQVRFFYPPLEGRISAPFDSNKNHHGIDVLGIKNSAISSITSGTIISAEYNIETGNTISIQHDNNIVSTYKHNSKLLKSVGEYVRSGEAIAIIGNTGIRSDGYHLHFELWIDGESVNPQNYIDFTK